MLTRYTDISVKPYNSFGVEAKTLELIEFESVRSLCEVFPTEIAPKPWYVLSGGNNILFTGDYEGVLIHPRTKGINISDDDGWRVTVHVEAGEEWDDVVQWCVDRELWGIENLSLIPGYAGAAPVQNIGAYGVELGDVIDSVEVLYTDTLVVGKLSPKECRFGYRDSIFKNTMRGRMIIIGVNLVLSRVPAPNLSYGDLAARVIQAGEPTLKNIREAVCKVRREKLPDPKVQGNAGSFFKNPIVLSDRIPRLRDLYPLMPVYPADKEGYSKLSAAWLIDQAGWKGYIRDNVQVHIDQPLVLVNLGGATGREVLRVAMEIQSGITAKFGIKMEMEVNILGASTLG